MGPGEVGPKGELKEIGEVPGVAGKWTERGRELDALVPDVLDVLALDVLEMTVDERGRKAEEMGRGACRWRMRSIDVNAARQSQGHLGVSEGRR